MVPQLTLKVLIQVLIVARYFLAMVEFPDTLIQCHAGIGSRRTAFEKLPMKAVIDFFEKGEKIFKVHPPEIVPPSFVAKKSF